MSPRQIQQLAKVMVNSPEIMAILKGGEEDVERGIQKGISESVRPRSEGEKEMVGRGVEK